MLFDIEQFQKTFLEESFEGLDAMEGHLLSLDINNIDPEEINTIFRIVHSIKGGSGTFSFQNVMDFTHVVETLLDEMRNGFSEVTHEAVETLLQVVDCVREMLTAASEKTAVDSQRATSLQNQLVQLLQGPAASCHIPDTVCEPDQPILSEAAPVAWHIHFQPYPHFLREGHEPWRIFRALESLGTVVAKVDASDLPMLSQITVDMCYLGWNLELYGNISKESIEEVFAWVDGDCELTITSLDETCRPLSHAPTDLETPATESLVIDSDHSTPHLQSDQVAKPVLEPSLENRPRRGESRTESANADSSSVRVSIGKIDSLINMVGELVITQAMLSEVGESFDMSCVDRLRDGLDQLERNTRELQEAVLQIRMLPISIIFHRFSRLVHDLTRQLEKRVDLKISGEHTELDKIILEKIGDPLVHLVRNALDHGIEPPQVRQRMGKPEIGSLNLRAYHQSGNAVIEISDDGAGIDKEKIRLKAIERGFIRDDDVLTDKELYEVIFKAGFSTAQAVSDVSGRGVGMDVVLRNIQDLGGVIEIDSELGEGTTFTISLPLTLAILDGQLVRVGTSLYVIPLVSIIESLEVAPDLLTLIAGQAAVYKVRDSYVPVIEVQRVLRQSSADSTPSSTLLVVVESHGQKIGLLVHELLGQHQVVVKGLEDNFKGVEGVSGATILGDGSVALILDIAGLIGLSQSHHDIAATRY